ncbi:MAG: hypothetical protein WBA12_13905, partial [Catalinimonas sp.]
DNDVTGTFVPGTGEVVFSGGQGTQRLYTNSEGANPFYRITISKDAGTTLSFSDNDTVRVASDLRVLGGILDPNGRVASIGGNLTVIGGDITDSGTLYFNKAGGTANIRTGGATPRNLHFEGTGTYVVQDALTIGGSFTLGAGVTFKGNGRQITLGNGLDDAILIEGDFRMEPAGQLRIGGAGVTVQPGGTFRAVGTAAEPVVITARSSNRYNFAVYGTLHARHYQFASLAATGLFITSDGTIDPTNNLSDGTFSNGRAAGTLLRIANDQDLTGTRRIERVNFADNPGSGSHNVTKVNDAGQLEFYESAGVFSGATYESDPHDRVQWTGTSSLVWNGSVNTNWHDAGNWSPAQVPTAADKVIIASAPSQQPVITSVAYAGSIEVETGAFLSVRSADEAVDLVVEGDLIFAGGLTLSANDSIVVGGNFTRQGGTFAADGGVVTMASTSRAGNIECSLPFADLVIAAGGTVIAASELNVEGDLVIENGSTFDASAAGFSQYVGGDFLNQGTYVGRLSTLTLNRSAGTGSLVSGGATFNRLVIAGGAGATYRPADPVQANRFVLDGGTFEFDGQTVDVTRVEVNGGTLNIGAGATLRLADGGEVSVNNGGTFEMVGVDENQLASVRSQGSGRYAFVMRNGGTLRARYYEVRNLNSQGLKFLAGASLHAADNLRDGTFSFGAAGGCYLDFRNNFADFVVDNVRFDPGATNNVRRTEGSGVVTFHDATGVRQGAIYELDDQVATAGRVRWTYSVPLNVWNSVSNNNWHEIANWSLGRVPQSGDDVIIDGLVNITDADAVAGNIRIYGSGTLNVQSNRDLAVDVAFENNGTLRVADGSNSTISVRDAWTNEGTVNFGTTGTLWLNGTAGTHKFISGGSLLRNLVIDGTMVYELADDLRVLGNLDVTLGTLAMTNSSQVLRVGGNWRVSSDGSFINADGEVILDGTGTQTIVHEGGGGLHELTLTNTGTRTLLSDLTVSGNLHIANGTLQGQSHQLRVGGNWRNEGTFQPGTGTVVLAGNSSQAINPDGTETFHNLSIDNASGTVPQILLLSPVNVTGTLGLQRGVVDNSAGSLLTLTNGATSSLPLPTSYISGPVAKVGATDFIFPVGNNATVAPIGISGLTESATFVAEYFDAPFRKNDPLKGDLFEVSGVEHWDLSRVGGGAAAYVTVYWEDSARSRINELTSVVVAHYDGSAWESFGGQDITMGVSGSVRSAERLTSFSPIKAGSNSAPLPVELTQFAAAWHNGGRDVRLTWRTATEIENDRFEIYRSFDASEWSQINSITGAGTTTEPQAYAWTDRRVVGGPVYYRLRQVDFDGSSEWSQVVSVGAQPQFGVSTLSVTPNPFGKVFDVHLTSAREGTARLTLV